MELSDIQALAERLEKFKDGYFNEANTKQSLILPFVRMLGYDTDNPTEVTLEYEASFGVKKNARVDIAVMREGIPSIFIECKPLGMALDITKVSQLFAYFAACPDTRIGILTNGREYQIFSDTVTKGVMDKTPFLSFDITSFDKGGLPTVQKLGKDAWDLDFVLKTARRLKNLATVKKQIRKDATTPDDDVVRHFASLCHCGKMTQSVIDDFRPLVVQAFREYIAESTVEPTPNPAPVPEPEPNPTPGIVTHDSEKFAYVTVKTLMGETVDPSRIQMHDYKGFCAVQLDGTPRKTICRFFWFEPVQPDGTIGKDAAIEILSNGKDGEPVRHSLATVEDILPFKEELAQAVRSYLEGETA